VNFFGTLNSIKAVDEYFKNKKEGIITIVSSIAGYRGLPKFYWLWAFKICSK
jgi:NAD(P)-dependent dehydrogenase (short-subunit alcohol dehydrogenase family)